VTYSVTLEHGSDGSYLAWVYELPGCFARAQTREEVEAKLPDAIRSFAEWAGEPDGDFAVVAEVESVIDSSEDTEVLLEPDRRPLTQDDWARIERWLEKSRAELHDVDAQHMGFVELMYVAWTFDVDSKEFLDWTRKVALERMRELAQTDDGRVTEARWAGAPRSEPWTARKAARRLVWHERVHLPSARDA
jgi:predicted RNase H-like HicB family nuclease